jgi:DNA-directed RNA polymerase subunit RPC12/RpoP
VSTLAGKTTATIRCGLCKEVIELESSFRPTPAACPYCGLKFVFDPQEQPLPVRGMRLRWSEVEAVQLGGGTAHRRRHDAHALPRQASPAVEKNSPPYLAWAGTLAIGTAALLTLFRWLHR